MKTFILSALVLAASLEGTLAKVKTTSTSSSSSSSSISTSSLLDVCYRLESETSSSSSSSSLSVSTSSLWPSDDVDFCTSESTSTSSSSATCDIVALEREFCDVQADVVFGVVSSAAEVTITAYFPNDAGLTETEIFSGPYELPLYGRNARMNSLAFDVRTGILYMASRGEDGEQDRLYMLDLRAESPVVETFFDLDGSCQPAGGVVFRNYYFFSCFDSDEILKFGPLVSDDDDDEPTVSFYASLTNGFSDLRYGDVYAFEGALHTTGTASGFGPIMFKITPGSDLDSETPFTLLENLGAGVNAQSAASSDGQRVYVVGSSSGAEFEELQNPGTSATRTGTGVTTSSNVNDLSTGSCLFI